MHLQIVAGQQFVDLFRCGAVEVGGAQAVLENDDRVIAVQRLLRPLENSELCSFHIDLDHPDVTISHEVVEASRGHLDDRNAFVRAVVTAGPDAAVGRVAPDVVERHGPCGFRDERSFVNLDGGKVAAEAARQVGKGFDGDMAHVRCGADEVGEDLAGVSADVDRQVLRAHDSTNDGRGLQVVTVVLVVRGEDVDKRLVDLVG